MDTKEAKEIIKVGFEWANWTDEQKKAFEMAYNAIGKAELMEQQMERFEYLVSYEYSHQIDNVKSNGSAYRKGALEGMENYNRKWKEVTGREIETLW